MLFTNMSKSITLAVHFKLMIAYCILSSSPVRLEPSDRSEMISQLLFGEGAEVLELNDNWMKVKCLHDAYEGWVDPKMYVQVDKEISCEILSYQMASPAIFNGEKIPILMGSSLPKFDGLHFKLAKNKYDFSGNSLPATIANKKRIAKIALQYLNAPYLWGGRSIFGIDCSGFTQIVYKFLDIKLPRDAYQQAELGNPLGFVAEAKVGDLAYFGDEEKITHVGIVLEGQKIIHASGKVRIDNLDHVGIYNKDSKKYTHKLKVIKRLFE